MFPFALFKTSVDGPHRGSITPDSRSTFPFADPPQPVGEATCPRWSTETSEIRFGLERGLLERLHSVAENATPLQPGKQAFASLVSLHPWKHGLEKKWKRAMGIIFAALADPPPFCKPPSSTMLYQSPHITHARMMRSSLQFRVCVLPAACRKLTPSSGLMTTRTALKLHMAHRMRTSLLFFWNATKCLRMCITRSVYVVGWRQ
ncbi:hypothetical protein QBC43DRAFT_79756 [Cladorrhinum sp. PSN259]|nr:hypothetical protein QBC43DRAFT_79756 [Cladorrhinum sp. PSN259]